MDYLILGSEAFAAGVILFAVIVGFERYDRYKERRKERMARRKWDEQN